MWKSSTNAAWYCQGRTSGLPSSVCFINQVANGRISFPKSPGGSLAIHDDKSATGTKLFPNLTKNGTMMRHDVIGKAEKHTIKQFSTCVIDGIGFNQHEVSPLPAMAQFPCPAQHAFG